MILRMWNDEIFYRIINLNYFKILCAFKVVSMRKWPTLLKLLRWKLTFMKQLEWLWYFWNYPNSLIFTKPPSYSVYLYFNGCFHDDIPFFKSMTQDTNFMSLPWYLLCAWLCDIEIINRSFWISASSKETADHFG